jgi:hypothetical protein
VLGLGLGSKHVYFSKRQESLSSKRDCPVQICFALGRGHVAGVVQVEMVGLIDMLV